MINDQLISEQENFLDTEEWKPVHTLPGFSCAIEYFVNRQGDVMSTKGSKPKVLKTTVSIDGYELVTLQQRIGRKKPKTVAVHKLVAFAFLPPPPLPYGNRKGCCNIDHADDDKLNNNVSNLLWSTVKDNMIKKEYARGKGSKICLNPSELQVRHREVCRKHVNKIFTDPEKLEKHRAYKREWIRKKRARSNNENAN